MQVNLFKPEEVSAMIKKGAPLLIAGDIKLLKDLPKGKWIGGSTPYFLLHPNQRVTSHDKLYVSPLPDYVKSVKIRTYDVQSLRGVFTEAPVNGFTVLILPFNSFVATDFALRAPFYKGFGESLVCGWQSGRDIDAELSLPAFVICGEDGKSYYEKAVAMHVELPKGKKASMHTFSPYRQGKGDDIVFKYSSKRLIEGLVAGKQMNIAQYLRDVNYDPHLPLVATYADKLANVSCLCIDESEVNMYAPVYQDVIYRIGELDTSVKEPSFPDNKLVFSVTCVLNFLQPNVVSRYMSKMNGPVGFGEIAGRLLNQTTVYVTVDDVK